MIRALAIVTSCAESGASAPSVRQATIVKVVSASYLGTETSHMWTLQQMNPAVFMGLGACTIAGMQYATCSTISNNDQRRRLNLAYPTGLYQPSIAGCGVQLALFAYP